MVRPKAVLEGVRPREIFVKKTQKCDKILRSGLLLAQCAVEYMYTVLSTTADAQQIYEYESRKRSKSAHMH